MAGGEAKELSDEANVALLQLGVEPEKFLAENPAVQAVLRQLWETRHMQIDRAAPDDWLRSYASSSAILYGKEASAAAADGDGGRWRRRPMAAARYGVGSPGGASHHGL